MVACGVVSARQWAADPLLDGRDAGTPGALAGRPQPARRELHERQVVADRVRERRGVGVRPARPERLAQVGGRPWLFLHELPSGRQQLVEIDALDLRRERAARVAALDHVLHHRPEREEVVGGDEVHRPSHQRPAHDLLGFGHARELGGVEVLEAAPAARCRAPAAPAPACRPGARSRPRSAVGSRRSSSWRWRRARLRARVVSTAPHHGANFGIEGSGIGRPLGRV